MKASWVKHGSRECPDHCLYPDVSGKAVTIWLAEASVAAIRAAFECLYETVSIP
jgi:hypothetical protein